MSARPSGPPFTLHGLVEANARERPDRTAVRAHGERATHAELDRQASAIASHLAAIGVRRGDRVALYQPKSLAAVAEIIGILKCGAAYVPIDPLAPPERARFILEHSGARVLFAGGRPLKQLAKAAGDARVVADLVVDGDAEVPGTIADRVETLAAIRARGAVLAERTGVIDRDLAYVLYTSGSTGTPKGVAITHAQSLAFVRTATETFALAPDDVFASHAPFNFDLSIIDLFCAFAAGGAVALIPETFLAFPARIAKLIAEEEITVWNSVPSALIQLAGHGALASNDVSRLRIVMFAGEPFPLKHLRRLAAALPGAKLYNVYGQTEANSSTYFEIGAIPESDDAPLPVGRVFPNYSVFILDEKGAEITSPGVEGELYVAGSAVASGYFGDPERTAKAFVPHPLRPGVPEIVYRTGDRFALDANGELVFRGRADAAVKVRGFRVELAEIEAAGASHSEVEEVAVLAVPDEAAGHRLVLFAVAARDAVFDEAAFRSHLAARLPRYMLPDAIVLARALPRTATGKVDRRALEGDAASLYRDGGAR